METISNIFAKYPFFRLVAALILGIVAFEFLGFSWAIFLVLSLVAIVGFLWSIFYKNSYSGIFGIAIIIAIFCFGYLLSYNFNKQNTQLDNENSDGIFHIELIDFPVIKEKSVLLKAKLISRIDSQKIEAFSGKAMIYMFKDSSSMSLKSGDRLLIDISMSLPKSRGNPYEFDYRKYLLRKGFCATGYVDAYRWKKIGHNGGFSLLRLSQYCRLRLLDIYRELNINGDEFAILSALSLGYTYSLDSEVRENFSATGVAHILSVSGFHVGVIYTIIIYLLWFLDKNSYTKKIKFVLIILLLWFYAFITGLSPAVCRAALMFSVFLVGLIFNKRPQIYNTILFSAFVLLLINPMWLFDLGFQLSYSALLSIIYFQPKLSKLITFKNKIMRNLWDLIIVSISAQIGVAPLGLYYFHQFPMYFIIANIIAIPLSFLIVYTDVFLLYIYKIDLITPYIEWFLVYILKILYRSLQFIKEIKYSVVFCWINSYQVVLLYIFIFALIMLNFNSYAKIKYNRLVLLLLSLILFFAINIYQQVYNYNYRNLVVFNDSNNIIVNAVQPNANLVLTTDSNIAENIASNFWLRYDICMPIYKTVDSSAMVNAFCFDSRRFALLGSNNIFKTQAKSPLEVDYLIIAKNIFPTENIFKYYFNTKNIVIASGMSAKNISAFERIAQKNKINSYSIDKRGAFYLYQNK